MRVGIIGCGAIGQSLCALIPQNLPEVQISAVVERDELHSELRARLDPNTRIETSVSALLDLELDLVIECAGHAALKSTGPMVLEHGMDLLVVSVGALADPETEAALVRAAALGRSKVRIPAGALGGLDVLGAAKLVGLERVLYSSNKAPLAWKGTPAESMIALDDVNKAAVFFSGTAREAAQLFPQNANVAVAVALAGIGFDKTMVSLRADPNVTGNTHRIEAGGLFGEVSVRIVGKPLAGNPKTSMLAPYSVVRSLANLSHPAAMAEIPELAPVKHVFVKASARLNNRAENSHQPTRERERRMRGFRDPGRTQAFLSSFGPIRQHFALKRHLLCASPYRKQLAVRFDAWHRFTELTQIPPRSEQRPCSLRWCVVED